ncbi:MAG: cysteine dioxygenase family protein [Flavobacteriales bacterium]|nr:cysteine dioxygenase family protein [Flavobacteriales bacterium]
MHTHVLPHVPSSIGQGFALVIERLRSQIRGLATPSLELLCYRLQVKAMTAAPEDTATCFQAILDQAERLSRSAWDHLADQPKHRQVLVDNPYLKVVLIQWEAGESCAVHGHPSGGGLIKVLQGTLEESRFISAAMSRPYSVQRFQRKDTSYIEDRLGLHSITNPGDGPAVSLHAYLKYR